MYIAVLKSPLVLVSNKERVKDRDEYKAMS
jgi:hypothetical protein